MFDPKNPKTEIALTFTANEFLQLEAFAALHGETIAAFVQRVVLEAAGVAPLKTPTESRASDMGVLWLTDGFPGAPETKEEETPAPFTVADAPVALTAPAIATVLKRGVVGEQSQLAKGHGPVWEVRRGLGRERVHGLGWTREQLAFVLKLSVVGVRKMEHQGTTPIKSLEVRKALLGLAKTLETPGAEIAAYIEREANALV